MDAASRGFFLEGRCAGGGFRCIRIERVEEGQDGWVVEVKS